MSSSINIRQATRQDIEDLVTMGSEFDAYLRAIEPGDPPFDRAKMASGLERFGFGDSPLCQCLIAEDGERAVGYAIYSLGYWADAHEGMVFLTDLFVRQEWWSKGVGQRLMKELATIGRAAGCQRVMWTVWTKNAKAVQFYRELGAEEIEEERLMSWRI